ncbi:MAG TPA: hypothetical protein VF210_12695 [Pseudomonadales bacterium]
MSWAVFAVLQLAITTVGVATVFLLRNRELTERLRAQERVASDAADLLEQACARFQTMADEVLGNWLAERALELDDDDPVQRVQKLVLQNEREPIPDFAEEMRRRIAAGDEAQAQNRESWLQLRMDLFDLASGLIERYPRSHPVVVQLYEAFAFRDAEFGVELPALPEPNPSSDDEAETEGSEHLRAANELLLRQLEDAQKEITRLRTTGRHLQQQEEDLKALLQQFTRDSRDMMACIQELEQENQRLREQLREPQPDDAPDPDEAAATGEASAAPLADDPLAHSA